MGLMPDLPPLTDREERLLRPIAQKLADAMNENRRLRAALEKIAQSHTRPPYKHVGDCHEIARKALAEKKD
jgi:hypothetical protein